MSPAQSSSDFLSPVVGSSLRMWRAGGHACLRALAESPGPESLWSLLYTHRADDPWDWEDLWGLHATGQVKGKDGVGGWNKTPFNNAEVHKSRSAQEQKRILTEETRWKIVSSVGHHMPPFPLLPHLLLCPLFVFTFCRDILFYVPNSLIIVVV